LRDVLVGIDRAVAAGFPRPRVNMVVLRGINDDEVLSMARWGMSYGLEVRFLEAMPIGPAAEFNRRHFVSGRAIRQRLESAFDVWPLRGSFGETARRYDLSSDTASGIVGIIAPVSEPFCSQCRRMRLTAGGRLYPCLLDDRFVDLHPAWSRGEFNARMTADLVLRAVGDKAKRGNEQRAHMVELGG
jgi:cyclic pyranopterin phosphate synthase